MLGIDICYPLLTRLIKIMKINFTKMNGAGNDFILIDQKLNLDFILSEDLIKQMCDRRKGIGADGILFIKKNNEFDFELEYYNSDGSLGSLCGNGARCSIKYGIDNLVSSQTETKFKCNNEVYCGSKIDENTIQFNLNKINEIRLNEEIIINSKKINTHFVNNGSPHTVIFWDNFKVLTKENFDNFDLHNLGNQIRNSDFYNPSGTNVNVIKLKEDYVKIRTYERGVEAETFACGTGTVASAIISNLILNLNPPIKFLTKDNDILTVSFEKKNSEFVKINLTGPAKINYIGTYNFFNYEELNG